MTIKHSSFRLISGLILIAMLVFTSPIQGARAVGRCYVKWNASEAHTGDSWTNAYTDLQSALGTPSCTEVWVAAGTYKPGAVRTATFQLMNNVAVYGGFAGTEDERDGRDPAAHLTVLSGDVDNNDSQTPVVTDLTTVTGNTTNASHVVTITSSAVLDGFTITGGYSSGAAFPDDSGGGLLSQNNSPILNQLNFSGNYASGAGGGLYNSGSTLSLTNTIFSNNGSGAGAGLFNAYSNNMALTDITFSGNTSTNYAGGMFNWDSTNTSLTNVTFSGNSATNYGGGIVNRTSSPTLTNVTLSGNSANYGGGLWNVTSSYPVVRNSIFWGNTAPNGSEIYNWSDGNSTSVSDSVVQGGFGGTNVITTDPQLGSLGNNGGYTQTIALQSGSSAIDTGADDPVCPPTDQRGIHRPQGSHCDIGAFEVNTILMAVPGGLTSGYCESWTDACELRYALTSAISGDQIWAAAGTYKPTSNPSDSSATFQLKPGVAVYGGFAGTEDELNQRNPQAHLTVLSGDIDGNDSQTPVITDLNVTGNTGNSKHVVTGANAAILEGFTITGGYAFGPGAAQDYGGGIYDNGCSPMLVDDNFSGNWARYGGGMFNDNGSLPSLTQVTFNANYGATQGGGLFSQGASIPTLVDVTFTGNTSAQGGGMFNHNGSNADLTDVTFADNSATDVGGGMVNQYNSDATLNNVTFNHNTATNNGGAIYNLSGSDPQITNATLYDNIAANGAGIYNSGSSPVLNNVTLSHNHATGHGGGMFMANYSYPQFYNSIFWGNIADGGIGAQIYNFSGDSTSSDNVVQGGCADTSWSCGTNVITADPHLGTLGDHGGDTWTIPLLAGSSAIGKGNDSTCAPNDQRDVLRPQGLHCDIGAFEDIIFTIHLPLLIH